MRIQGGFMQQKFCADGLSCQAKKWSCSRIRTARTDGADHKLFNGKSIL
jgi:hypothetical protein